ncbi:MAG: hypothetical protein M5R36_19650 [Deltaproteobacteria bacterium]|nr:hypothetical protein [Deltaproteobacteria bacterium]
MEIDVSHVLWRTRGQNWDYSFILRPEQPAVNSWYEIHSQVFSNLTPDATQQTSGGTISIERKEVAFQSAVLLIHQGGTKPEDQLPITSSGFFPARMKKRIENQSPQIGVSSLWHH